jgi:hypothetical protein
MTLATVALPGERAIVTPPKAPCGAGEAVKQPHETAGGVPCSIFLLLSLRRCRRAETLTRLEHDTTIAAPKVQQEAEAVGTFAVLSVKERHAGPELFVEAALPS